MVENNLAHTMQRTTFLALVKQDNILVTESKEIYTLVHGNAHHSRGQKSRAFIWTAIIMGCIDKDLPTNKLIIEMLERVVVAYRL